MTRAEEIKALLEEWDRNRRPGEDRGFYRLIRLVAEEVIDD